MAWDQIEQRIGELEPELVRFRRDLHAHPELAYEEVRTSAKVLDAIRAVPNLEVRSSIAGTGIVALLRPDLEGPLVALRADMDALPMQEMTGLPYASTYPGKMHACGHDGHTAMLVGAVRLLGDLQDELAGPVAFIFQPAEEGGAGARAMLEDGAFDGLKVAAVFGLHNWPNEDLRVGEIGLRVGPAMAGTGTFEIVVKGRGGHAAFPHNTVDPIYVGSLMVQALQGIVARNVDPLDSAVVSVTQFHAGTAKNVIVEEARLAGTFRALKMDTLTFLRERILRVCHSVAESHGAELSAEVNTGYPVLDNDVRAIAVIQQVAEEIDMGSAVKFVQPVMGGEDFAYFQERAPGAFWFLGAMPPEAETVPFPHNPRFDFNDAILPLGLRMHVELALRFARIWRDGPTGQGLVSSLAL